LPAQEAEGFIILDRANATLDRSIQSELFDAEARRYHDLTTWLAEALDGQMRTPFTYRFDGRELYAQDNSPLRPIFDDAIADARNMAVRNPKMAFELRRRIIERDEYADMLAMGRGELPNTMIVISDFPPELLNATQDTGGYNVTRKQTMLRIITKTADGSMGMYSQTLDGSNRAGLEALYEAMGFAAQPGELLGQRMHVELSHEDQEFLADHLTGVYDRTLTQKYGGAWRAGRSRGRMENTYDFVLHQQDLVQAALARGVKSERDLYDLAAAMQRRFENVMVAATNNVNTNFIPHAGNPYEEMRMAGLQAQSEGKTFSGCGASASVNGSETGDASGAAGELREAGYGNKSEESAALPKLIRCVNEKCRQLVPSKQVVKEKSWCCPKCKYEVDICSGKVLCAGK